MDFEFSSREELFQRVKPALNTKVRELHRFGYTYINQNDVFNYLGEKVWSKSFDLTLADIVSDILNTEAIMFDNYLKEKYSMTERAQYFEKNNNIEII
jgi:hypothetical protein